MNLTRAALSAALTFAWAMASALDAVSISERNEPTVVVTVGVRPATGAEVQGSGCYVHAGGLVLCTAHQISELENLRVRLGTGKEYPAAPLAVDASQDLVLLATNAPASHLVTIGDARTLKMGSPLLAITSPQGLEFSATSGIVSSMNRTYKGMNVIQTDLPAGEGSSGGPVFDENGRLVGIIMGRVEEFQGAILMNPINNAFGLLASYGAAVPRQAPPESGTAELIPAHDTSQNVWAAINAYNRGVRAESSLEKARHYGLAVELLPEFFEAWFNLGVSLSRTNPESALNAYSTAVRLNSASAAAHRNLGLVLLQYQRLAEGAEAFREAVRLDPNDPVTHNDLGEAYRRLERYDEAETEFRKALELRPTHAAARYNLALTYLASGKDAQAVEEFSEYLRLHPNASDAEQVATWIAQLQREAGI